VVPLRVRVRYFAAHKDLAGSATETLQVPEGTTVAGLLDHIITLHPRLEDLRRDTMVSVNKGVGPRDQVLEEGDDVALFPPIQGG
jgi:molybdopterin converting factor subunit 1